MKIKFPPKLVRFVTEKGLTIVAVAVVATFVVSLFFVQKKDVKFFNGNFEYEKAFYEYDVAVVKRERDLEEVVIIVYPIQHTDRLGLEMDSNGAIGFSIEDKRYTMDAGKAYFVTIEDGKPLFRAYSIVDGPIMYYVTLKDLRTKIMVLKDTYEVDAVPLPVLPPMPLEEATEP